MRRTVFKGAVWTEPLNKYMALFDDFANEQSLMAQQSNSMSQEEMMQAYLTLRKPLDEFAKNQMRKEPANPVNIILMSSLTPSMGWEFWDPSNLEILNQVAAAFNEKYKGSPIAEDMAGQQQQLSNSYQQFLAYKESQTTGGTVPEIELPTPEGKMLKLSSLRGKVVLIDFWASWCGPCRRENPNVVKMYNQYKNKGFTVFSVSLDENGEAWKKAIAMDGLLWPNHVSDLKGWNTPMTQLYGFNAIPHTVLIDANGKVIATNLRGQDLEQKLKEIL
jgi:thiol-disulfide isomerase/thioredoxin